MAQMTVKLGFKLHWWTAPFLFVACWGAYPFLWAFGEAATQAYVDAVSRFIRRHGIGRCELKDASYQVTLE